MATSSTTTTTTTTTTDSKNTLTGCVKWFNNSYNYGFITVLTEGESKGTDIFVHQSNIKTKRDCFRTLYTGECVQFELTKSENKTHPVHAVNVTAFNDGMLHCENPSYRTQRLNTNNSDNEFRGRGSSDRGSSDRGSSGRGRGGSSRGRGGSGRGIERSNSNQ